MKKIFFLWLLLALSFFAKSQVITIFDENQKTIPNVIIYSNNFSIISDKNGEAKIDTTKTNNDLIFEAEGYLKQIITFSELKKSNFKVILESNTFEIEEVTVSANKWEQKMSESSLNISPVNTKNIDFTNPQTVADLLATNDKVFMQKSQLGGGSPMLRGFAANRLLIVVDGVRMNNAIYRSGNLQNILNLDATNLEEAEIIFGPGSVIYGSDAIGGVMDFHTFDPKFNSKNLNSIIRYSSANNEKTGSLSLNIGFKKIAFFSSFSYSDFDDLKMGSVGFEEYTRPEYVAFMNEKDSILQNSNPNLQKNTAYSTYNFLHKISLQVSSNLQIKYSFNYSTTSNIPRYDRLIEYSNEKLKYGDWFYGPQKFMLQTLNLKNSKPTFLYDNFKLIFSFQDYTESRHDRKLNKSKINERTDNVKVGAINFDLTKKLSTQTILFYGIQSSYNYVTSYGFEKNIISNETEPISSRYPNSSTYQNYDVYAQLKTKINDNFVLNYGARYSYVMIKAEFDTTFFKFPFTETELNKGNITGSIGMVYKLGNNWSFSANLSTGFRSPNIDDIGKVFDSEPGNVVVPNNKLSPEYIYDGEIGINKNTTKYFFNSSVFYSYLDNAMIRSDFNFNGQDSIIYDGEMSKVQALTNDDFVVVYGVQASFGVQITKNIVLKTSYNFLDGHESDSSSVRHVPPAYGATHLSAKTDKFKIDLYANYNAKISNEKLSSTEKDKPTIYAKDTEGNPYCPAWWTLNLKMQYKINKYFNVNAGIENILDYRYRTYSSGIVSPGRNFIVSLKIKF